MASCKVAFSGSNALRQASVGFADKGFFMA
jgi:hypothetical protein